MERYQGRAARTIENDALRLVVLAGGGHIAAIVDKRSGVSPLWMPPWPSKEPSAFTAADEALYGSGSDARLLAGIMGHNLCLDIFGGPSDEEAAAGLTAHGEGSVVHYDIDTLSPTALTMAAELPLAQLQFRRSIELIDGSVRIVESIDSRSSVDRPIGWTEHVTLGPPFLERGVTEFAVSASESKVFDGTFGPADYLAAGAEFRWPHAPRPDGTTADLRRCQDAAISSAYTTHLLNREREDAFFVAFSPTARLAFGYLWRREDFPWLGIWEENHSRTHSPWNGRTLTRGMEFGVSPFPESRKEAVARGQLFGVPTYGWLAARGSAEVEYWVFLRSADTIMEGLETAQELSRRARDAKGG